MKLAAQIQRGHADLSRQDATMTGHWLNRGRMGDRVRQQCHQTGAACQEQQIQFLASQIAGATTGMLAASPGWLGQVSHQVQLHYRR